MWWPSARATARAARRLRSEHGIGRVHGSYDELLADPDVEAVYIPLPNSMHVPWAVQGARGGQARAVREAADAACGRGRGGVRRRRPCRPGADGGVHVALPPADRGARAAGDGAVAPLRYVRGSFGFAIADDAVATCACTGDLDGGALMDVGCYCVSGLRLLCGEPERGVGRAGDGRRGCRRALRRRAAVRW